MKITKINPRTPLEEAIAETTIFNWVYELLDNRIANMDNLLEKRFVKKGDKALALEFGLLLHGQKILFQMSEDHAKFIYGIRDIVSEYGNTIEELSTHIEFLARESTNKKLTDKILESLVKLENRFEKIRENQNRLSVGLADARNDLDEFRKAEERFWEQSAKKKDKRR